MITLVFTPFFGPLVPKVLTLPWTLSALYLGTLVRKLVRNYLAMYPPQNLSKNSSKITVTEAAKFSLNRGNLRGEKLNFFG